MAQNRTRTRARANNWEKAFIASLRLLGNVTLACEAAKVARRTVYNRRENDSEFKAEWDDALDEAGDRLEAEARRRAEEGTLKPVYQKGQLVGHIREYSDTLMALLLKAAKPEKYRDRQDVTSGGEKLPAPIVYLPEVSSIDENS